LGLEAWLASLFNSTPHSLDKDIAPNHGLGMVFPISQISFSNQVFQLGWLGLLASRVGLDRPALVWPARGP